MFLAYLEMGLIGSLNSAPAGHPGQLIKRNASSYTSPF